MSTTSNVPQDQLPPQLQEMMKSPQGQAVIKAGMNPPQPPSGLDIIAPAQPIDESTEREILDSIGSTLRRLLTFRKVYDNKRVSYYKQYVGTKDATTYPDQVTKRSAVSFKYPLSNVETIVSRVSDAFFSFDPWFDARPRGARDSQAAESMQMVLNQKLREADLTNVFEQFLRNCVIYGHAAMKVVWDWDFDMVTYAEPQLAMLVDPTTGQPSPITNPMTGEPIVLGYHPKTKMVPRNRPKLIPIDIFDLMVDPDGGYIVHMVERTWGQMLREAQVNDKLYRPEALQELSMRLSAEKNPEEVIIRMAECWDEVNGTMTLMTFGEDAEAVTYKDLRYAVRSGNSYSAYKRRVYAGKGILLWHGENPFLHKRAPILHSSYIKLPNEVYGMGAIEVISDLSDALDRFGNMIVDNWNLGINRRYAYDTNADIDHKSLNSLNVPGGKVAVSGDPNKVIAPLPFFTPNQGDYAILDMYKGMIETSGGVSDFYGKGVGSGAGNDTASGINQIINEGNYRFKLFIRNLEMDVLQPLLKMCAAMIQQFITDDIEVLITDGPAGIPKHYQVPPESLLGGLDFDIVAANYATNQVVKQRNLLALANVALQSPYVNQHNFLLEVCKVFQIRNVESLIKTEDQVQQEQAAQMQQQIQMMIFESMLQTESKARLSQSKPQTTKGKDGRPAKAQFEGKIPGAGLEGAIRSFAQSNGANALGLEGLGSGSGG